MDFGDLNPPLAERKGDTFFGLIAWAFILWGVVSLARCVL